MRTRGFTIVELFIAVGSISILVFLTAPRLETRRPDAEATVIGALRAIATAQQLHRDGGAGVYTDLAGLRRAGLIDAALAGGLRSGYVIEVAPSTTAPHLRWRAVANPIVGSHLPSSLRPMVIDQGGSIFRGLPGEQLRLPPDTCEVPAEIAHMRVGK